MKRLLQILILFFILFFIIDFFLLKSSVNSYNLSPKEALSFILDKKNSGNFILVDVRSMKEYNRGFINGAINIDWMSEKETLLTLNPSNTLVLYCQSGRRSKLAQEFLIKHNYESVYNISGGINRWNQDLTFDNSQLPK